MKIVGELEQMVSEDVTLDHRVHARIIGARGKAIRKIMDEFKVSRGGCSTGGQVLGGAGYSCAKVAVWCEGLNSGLSGSNLVILSSRACGALLAGTDKEKPVLFCSPQAVTSNMEAKSLGQLSYLDSAHRHELKYSFVT